MNGYSRQYVTVISRLGDSGEVGVGSDHVMLSDNNGNVVVYTCEKFEQVIADYLRFRERETGPLTPASA